VDHPKPWLRYVEADKIDDQTLDIDGMKVRNDAGDKLGTVDGAIVDSETGRTYYIAVDAGGWFKSKHFLVPIGEARLDADRDALVVSLSKDQVNRFPGFNKDEFDKLTEADIKRINDETCVVFEGSVTYPVNEPYYAAWNRPFYRYPDWWNSEMASGGSSFGDEMQFGTTSSAVSGRRERSQKDARAAARDVSPHFDGRAQPGDVLGVETGGERTYIGDTKDDENERRQDAEDADRKKRES
jgi:hypothetical protein